MELLILEELTHIFNTLLILNTKNSILGDKLSQLLMFKEAINLLVSTEL
jgi:hypothetical protein